MRTLRGTLGGYYYNKRFLTQAGLPTITGLMVQPEGREAITMTLVKGEPVYEVHDPDVYFFPSGKRLYFSDDCAELPHKFILDDDSHVVKMECEHPVPPPPP